MIYLVQNIHPEGVRLLEEKGLTIKVGDTLSEKEILAGAKNAEAIIIRSQGKLTTNIIENIPTLKCIGRYGTGVDNVDVEAANRLRIPIVYAPGINAIAVAEHVLMLILALNRKLAHLDAGIRQGKWEELRSMEFHSLSKKVVGIIGVGAIGIQVAKLASAFGTRILGFDPNVEEMKMRNSGITPTNFEELLAESDIVTVHIPLNAKTRNLLGEKEIGLMKKGTILINTARGGIVDESALARALKENRLSGAGLDVFKEEPVGMENDLLKINNTLVTPHSAGLTSEVLRELSVTVCEDVLRVLEGKKAHNIFNYAALTKGGPQIWPKK